MQITQIFAIWSSDLSFTNILAELMPKFYEQILE